MTQLIVHVSFAGLCLAMMANCGCLNGWTDAGGYCYNFTVGLTLPWDDARLSCIQDGGHMIVEDSANEVDVFARYRLSLPQQGDPMWIGVNALKSKGWAWLVDTPATKTYQNWLNGQFVVPELGQCVVTVSYNRSEYWQSMDCTSLLSFVCESTYKYTPTTKPTNVATTMAMATPQNVSGWHKVYQESIFQLSNMVVNSDVGSTRSVLSCAVACTTLTGCAAFNHCRANNSCQFIMAKVAVSSVSPLPGWDVWVDRS